MPVGARGERICLPSLNLPPGQEEEEEEEERSLIVDLKRHTPLAAAWVDMYIVYWGSYSIFLSVFLFIFFIYCLLG